MTAVTAAVYHGLDTTKPLAVNYGSEEDLQSFRAEYEKAVPDGLQHYAQSKLSCKKMHSRYL